MKMNEFLLSLLLAFCFAILGAALRAYGPNEYTQTGNFIRSLGLIFYLAAGVVAVVGPFAFEGWRK